MTKEHKLALIVGFALVLVVGVLISDHFSKASSAVLNDELTARDPRAFGSATDELNGPIMEPRPLTPAEQREREALAQARGTQMTPLPHTRPEEQPSAPIERGQEVAEIFDHNPIDIVMGNPNDDSLLDAYFEPVSGVAPLVKQDTPPGFVPVHEGRATASDEHRGSTDPLQDTRTQTRREPAPPPPLPPPPAPVRNDEPVLRHSVTEGESLFAIARRHYGDGSLWTRIRDANPKSVDKDGSVRAGVMLVIPGKPAAKPAAPPAPSPANAKPKRDAAPSKPTPGAYALYTVKPGDTLGQVAQKLLKTSKRADDIAALNKLDDPDHLVVGMQLKIPAQ